MSIETKVVNKLTIKTILGIERGKTKEEVINIMKGYAATNSEVAAVLGKVTGFGSKATQFGESTFFIGDFYAQNRETGEVFEGNKIYLPKDVSETIKAAFENRNSQDEYVKVSLTVSVVKDSGVVGYAYVCRPIKNPQSINERAEMLGQFAQLPAPEKKKIAQAK